MNKLKQLDQKLNNLRDEVLHIKREIAHQATRRKRSTKQPRTDWKKLSEEISRRWNGHSAVEEIRNQRDKAW